LQHANSAVVISAVKAILHFFDLVTNQETVRTVYKKLAPPLITLLNSEPEIQYVALRNINLVVLKHPKVSFSIIREYVKFM
jgi:AP-1 complex subunit beta-1